MNSQTQNWREHVCVWYQCLSVLLLPPLKPSWETLYRSRSINWPRKRLETTTDKVSLSGCPLTSCRVTADLLSRLISAWASSIFSNKSRSPITRAASLTSRHVSSRRVMHRTMVPSGTSVRSVIWSKGCEKAETRGRVKGRQGMREWECKCVPCPLPIRTRLPRAHVSTASQTRHAGQNEHLAPPRSFPRYHK